MKPLHETQFGKQHRHAKQHRAKGSAKHALTALVRAVGAEEADFMVGDTHDDANAHQRAGKRGKA